jgi:hypothetical protein
MKKLSLMGLTCAALLLGACGGGGSHTTNYPPPIQVPPPTPSTMVDAFFTLVTQYLSPTSEDTDATNIDAVVATQPEDTEPSEFS